MLSVRDAFEVLGAGLSFRGLAIDNETIRQLKLKNPKSIAPVLQWLRGIVTSFADSPPTGPIQTMEDLCEFFNIALSEEVPREINLLLLFGFATSELQVFDKLETQLREQVLGWAEPTPPTNSNPPEQPLPQFSTQRDTILNLIQAIRTAQRKISNLENRKIRREKRLCSLHKVDRWVPSFADDVSASRLQQVVCYFQKIEASPQYRSNFYSWFCQIFVDFYGALPRSVPPASLADPPFFRSWTQTLGTLSAKRKAIKTYLSFCQEKGAPPSSLFSPQLVRVLEALESDEPVCAADVVALLRATELHNDFEWLRLRLECEKILGGFLDSLEPGSVTLLPY